MVTRFSLGILFAVLVAASSPSNAGGANDLLAVGVRMADGHVVLGMPEGKARDAYERLLRSPAGEEPTSPARRRPSRRPATCRSCRAR